MKKFLAISALIIGTLTVLYFSFPGEVVILAKKFERGRAGLDQKELKISSRTYVYLEGGSGENILLIHGYGGDKDNWTRFARFLTPHYHVIIPDLPGFGESFRDLKLSYDIKSQSQRLDLFTEKIGVKKFHIAGNSMGGHLSLFYTAAHSDKVISCTLFDAAGVNEPVKSEFHRALENGKNPLVVSSPEDFNRLMNFVFFKPPLMPGALKNYFAVRAAKYHDFNIKVMKDLMKYPAIMESTLIKIKTPVLIIWGDKDRVLDISSVKVFENGLKNHTTKIIKNCGHLPMTERPKETARDFLEFITALK